MTYQRQNVPCKVQGSKLRKSQAEVLAMNILLAIPEADREVIRRFYLDRQSEEDIEKVMDLPGGQVKRLKASVRAKFIESMAEPHTRVS